MNGAEHGVIYFSLGSLVRGETLPQDKLKIFIEVFRQLPQRVVWKTDYIPDLPSNIRTSKWMPQFEILSKCYTVSKCVFIYLLYIFFFGTI